MYKRTKEQQAKYHKKWLEKNPDYYTIEKRRKWHQDWEDNNPERVKEYAKQRHIETYPTNKELISERHKKYHKTQKGKLVSKECVKRWRQRNPSKMKMVVGHRINLIKRATPLWYEKDLVEALYENKIRLNREWNVNLTVDHIIPINPRDQSVCGLHCWDNLQLLDLSLNSKKGDKYDKD